jgi:glycopeptide antibiotics resistance protein
MRINRLAFALLLAYLLVLAVLTLRPVGADVESSIRLNLKPFATILPALRHGPGTFAFATLVGNLLAFVPFGLVLPIAFRRLPWPGVILAGTLLSATIETTQYLLSVNAGHGYRAADIDDVIVNVAGTIVGQVIFAALQLGAWLLGRTWRKT